MKNLIKESVRHAINRLISESQSFNYDTNHVKEKFFEYFNSGKKIEVPIDTYSAENDDYGNYFHGKDYYETDFYEYESDDVVYAFMLKIDYTFDGKNYYYEGTYNTPEGYDFEITDFRIDSVYIKYFVEPLRDDDDFEGVEGDFTLSTNEIENLKNNIQYTY